MQGDGEGGVIVRGIKEPCGRVVYLTTHLAGHTARSRATVDNFDGEAIALYRIPSSGGKLARKQTVGKTRGKLGCHASFDPVGNCRASQLAFPKGRGYDTLCIELFRESRSFHCTVGMAGAPHKRLRQTSCISTSTEY